jgi:hypothetical protein
MDSVLPADPGALRTPTGIVPRSPSPPRDADESGAKHPAQLQNMNCHSGLRAEESGPDDGKLSNPLRE